MRSLSLSLPRFGVAFQVALLLLAATSPALAKNMKCPGYPVPCYEVPTPCSPPCGTGPPGDSGSPPPCCLNGVQATQYAAWVDLKGTEVVPGTGSTKTGRGFLIIDLTNESLQYDLANNLVGQTGTSIHGPASMGQNGASIVTIPAGAQVIGTVSFPKASAGALLAGNTYLQMETNAFANGEIRGQAIVSPGLPAVTAWGIIALVLCLLGTGAVVMLHRRRELA